jgi:hypothetical protein
MENYGIFHPCCMTRHSTSTSPNSAPISTPSALGITKGLGLSHKTNTILEGESLVNDASALIAYRFAGTRSFSYLLW